MMSNLSTFISSHLVNFQNLANTLTHWYGVDSINNHCYTKIIKLRYSVYVEELKKSLPQADHPRKQLPDELDVNAYHFLIKTKWGKSLGCVRLHIDDHVPRGVLSALCLDDLNLSEKGRFGYVSKLIVDRSIRGRGAAVKMMQAMIETSNLALNGKGDFALFHCNPRLVPIYERLGFHKFGRAFIDPYVGMQVPMVNFLGDFKHFKSINSPLTRIAKRFASSPSRIQELHHEFLVKRAFKDNITI